MIMGVSNTAARPVRPGPAATRACSGKPAKNADAAISPVLPTQEPLP